MPEHPDRSRRAFVAGAAATVALSTANTELNADFATGAGAPDTGLALLGATDAVARMVRGDITCERYAAVLLERCRAARALNAFITQEPDRVLAEARAKDLERRAGRPLGPLFGLPIPVKDSVNTAEYPTTAGTPALRHFQPRQDAPLVARLRQAGALVLGKTNLHELSYGWTSDNRAFGAVHNPYDPTRIPGGSSGGTAAAIAARMAPLGVAEDTEGSIRVPAALCGIAGFRPTTGRYPTTGCVPISPLFDQVGPHARNVLDLVLFDGVAAADVRPLPTAALAGLRLGIVRDYWYTNLDAEVERLTNEALARLREAGAVLVESTMPELPGLIDLTTAQVQNHDVRVALARYLHEYGAGVSFESLIEQSSTDIRDLFRRDILPGAPNFVSEGVYTAARDRHLPGLRRLYRAYFERTGVAAMVFPATLVGAPRIGEDEMVNVNGRPLPFETAIARNIAPGSTAGIPGLVLPCGLTREGLPVALEFDGPAGADRALLALGVSLERVLGVLPAPRV